MIVDRLSTLGGPAVGCFSWRPPDIKPYPLTSEPAGKINVTDPDSRNLTMTRGWVQG